MADPYFDKPPGPPLISDDTGCVVCLTVVVCAFLAFACYQPDAALKIGQGLAVLLGVILILTKAR